jgi:hypothetical protein
MISEVSRADHLAKLADAMAYVIDTIDSTSVVHELHDFTDAPANPDDLRLSLCRLRNEISNLQLVDSLK